MAGFLSAHGYDPGPTQRPLLAGAIAGALATLPAIAVLILFGSLSVESNILGIGQAATLAGGVTVMAFAGSAYARLFGRAANDVRSGWVFGMAFGFALWAMGATLILPLASGGRAPAGVPAIGLFLSLIIWGGALGLLQPFVHRPLHESLASGSARREIGPDAAAANRNSRGRRVKRERPEPPSRPRS